MPLYRAGRARPAESPAMALLGGRPPALPFRLRPLPLRGQAPTVRPAGGFGRPASGTVRRQGLRNEYTIRFFDFGSSRTIEVFHQVDSSRHLWLNASQDERWILYNELPEWQSELMLVENFR